jgi:hypothetical protein
VTPGAPVEIRWNSVTGQKIGGSVADGQGNFATTVSIPDVAPGVYSMVAQAGTEGLARTSFEVTAPAAAAPAPNSGAGSWLSRPTSALDSSGDSGSELGLVAGAALLGVGLLGLFSAFTVVAVRRRRVPIGAGKPFVGRTP